MGTLGGFFGFDGRLGRLGYLWRSLVAQVGLTLAMLAGLGFLAVDIRGFDGHSAWGRWLILTVMLLALWANFALVSRRLRDMGFEPTYIVPFYAALWVVSVVLLEPFAMLHPGSFGMLKHSWATLQYAAAIPLLFWPGRPPSEPRAPTYEPAAPTAYLNWRESG